MDSKFNANYLTEEEVEFELELRGITGLEGIDNKRRALRRVVRDENANLSSSKAVIKARPESDLRIINPIVDSLGKEIHLIDKKDLSKICAFETRLFHYLKRLERIEFISPENMSLYRYCIEYTKSSLESVSNLKKPFIKNKNMVDPNNILPISTSALNSLAQGNLALGGLSQVDKAQGGLISSSRLSQSKSVVNHSILLTEHEKLELEKAKSIVEALTKKASNRSNVTDMFSQLNINSQNDQLYYSSSSDEEVIPPQLPVRNARARVNNYQVPIVEPIRQDPQRNQPFTVRRLPVSRWSIKFSGDTSGLKLLDFLKHIELMAIAEETPTQELLRSAIHLFDGLAKTWYMAFGQNFRTWEQLVESLKIEFLPHDYNFWLKKEIENRLQKSSETFGIYLAHMELMFSRLPGGIPELEKIDILLRNVLPMYAEKLSLVLVDSVANLSRLCRQIETTAFRLQKRNPVTKNEVSFASPPHNTSSNQTMRSRSPNRLYIPPQQRRSYTPERDVVLRCYNCLQEGHHFNNCNSERRIFCFRCGKQGVTAPDCTRCESLQKNK